MRTNVVVAGNDLSQSVPLLILVYFGAQTILRTITPGGLGLDEAEVMVTAQSLEWGYGPWDHRF